MLNKSIVSTIIFVVFISTKAHLQDISIVHDSVSAQKYLHLADSLEKYTKEYENAAQYYTSAATYFYQVEDWKLYGHCKMRELYLLIDASKFDDAIHNITEAVNQINNKLPANNVFSFHCQVKKSLVYYHQAEYTKAIEILKNAIDTFKTSSESDSTNGKGVLASAYFEYGNSYLEIGKLDSAIYMYEKTLNLRQNIYKKNHELIVDCYNNLGIIYAYYGDYELAGTYMLKTLQAREELYGFEHPQTAWSYTNIAILNLYAENYGVALDYAYKGLESRKKCLSPGHVELASSYSTIANIYNETGDFDKSIEFNTLALDIYNNAFGEISIQSASIYNNMADNYNKHKMYTEALEYFKKAYQITFTESIDKVSPQQILHEINIADTYLQLNQIDSAAYYNNLAYKSNFAPVLQNRSIEALIDFEFAFLILEQKAQIHIRKYQLYSKINDLEIANKSYKDYLDLLDYFKHRASEEESKIEITRRNNDIMNDAMNVLYKLHMRIPDKYTSEDVGWLIEKNKSNTLLEMIDKTHNTSKFWSDSIAKTWKELTGDIYELKTERDYLLASNPNADIKNLTDSLFILQSKIYTLNEHFRNNFENISEELQPNSFTDNQKILKEKPNTAILNYYLSDSLIYICFTDYKEEVIRTAPIDSLFKKMVTNYLRDIRKHRLSGVKTLSPELYRVLIQPVSDLIQHKTKLVIIPDKFLYYLPFESLTNDISHDKFVDKTYLIHDYEIVYQYSTTIYCNYLSRYKSDHFTSESFLGFAPVFNKQGKPLKVESFSENVLSSKIHNEELLRSISVDGKTFNSLPYSEIEIREIASIYKSNEMQASAFYYADASKESFIQNCSKYKVLHLASHGMINESSPKLSGILFYPETDTTETTSGMLNTLLTAGEIYNLNIQAELVVLSACETGLGSVVQGEGVLSLTRAFTYAGAANIIYTLWKVGDKNSYSLMVKFYTYLLEGKTYSDALRKAKLDMIEQEETAFPGNWSAFSLISI